jgi:hypothetical protein
MPHPTRLLRSTVLVFSLVTSTLALSACGLFQSHPSDRALLAEFRAERADLERLVALARDDGQLDRISYEWFRTGTGSVRRRPSPGLLDAARWNEYRRLFHRLHLEEGVANGRDGIYLERSVSGLAISGSSKGFALLRARPDDECPSLDHIPREDRSRDSCYRHLDGDWYLFLDWT